jgi:hypothetical protein
MSFEDIQPFKIDDYFPNGFPSWYETFYEVVDTITYIMENNDFIHPLYKECNKRYNSQGRCGLYELAKGLTDKFELKNKDRSWDGEFFEEIDKFLEKELYEED